MNSGMEIVRIVWIMFCDKQLSTHGAQLTSVLSGPVLGPSCNRATAEKAALTVDCGVFGVFLKVLSLKEHLICNSVRFFTFLRDWPHVEVAFCAGYHKPV